MRVVLMVAVAALVALVVAVLTDSAVVAVVVVALAALGIVLLLRDWRCERRGRGSATAATPVGESADEPAEVSAEVTPEMFAPDISADGHGPSADARAD
ncbi:hypothetical protein ACXDF8_02095 [Mycolicibacterium sp. CBM1]